MKTFVKENYNRKILSIVLLVFIAGLASICFKYKDIGTMTKIGKKLPIYCVDTKEKKVAISFDASWGSDNTEKILEILDQNDVKATFFLVGGWIDQFPDKLKKLHEKGHEIGNHSNKHPTMTTISREKIIQEIANCDAKIMKITGECTKLFRCPEGAYNDLVIDTVQETNHYCIQWDVDSIDWKEQGAEKEYERIIQKTKPGSILLFHNNAKYTPENLPKIISKLKSEGYTFVKVGDLIYKDQYELDSSGKQIAK